jgi:hypothetical protein
MVCGMILQAGATIGDYKILGVIGSGGVGRVYRVEHGVTRRVEAMKVLQGEAHEPHEAERFLREIQVHASLNHPNIASVHNAFTAGDDLALVMELVDGESLEQVLAPGRIPWKEAIGYAGQALAALAHAHSRGVTHRDIKPANMLVTPEGVLKLTDFGLARTPRDRRLTQSGLLLGSAYYMAPEQAKNSAGVSERSDLYSLGVVLYEMVTGRKPFEGESLFAILSAHAAEAPQPPIEREPSIPQTLSDAILRALEKKPEDRFESAEQFREALADPHLDRPVQRTWLRRQAVRIGAAGAVAVLLGLAVGTRSPPAPKTAAPPARTRTPAPVAGNTVKVRTRVALSTETHAAGQKFLATLEAPLQSGNETIVPPGAVVDGVVAESDKGGRLKGRPWLAVRLTRVHLGGAAEMRITTNSIGRLGGGRRLLPLARGGPAVLPAGTLLEFRLE